VPEDGEFTLRLHDVIYRGGAELFYRLSIGTFPHIDYIMPVAGPFGEKQKFTVFGRNLSGGKLAHAKDSRALEQIEVELSSNDLAVRRPFTTLPAQLGLDLFEYRVRTDAGVSQPMLLTFPSDSVVIEQEPNNAGRQAQRLRLRAKSPGNFFRTVTAIGSSFDAKKGDVYWIEVISHRLGLATDPFVVIQRVKTSGVSDVLELNDSEANIGGAEFNTVSRDPAGKFEAKENGTYAIQIRDLFRQPQSNAGLVYRLIIRKPAPDFRLAALPPTPLPPKKDAKDVTLATGLLRRGETLPMKVLALRRDGFTGAIDLVADDLPTGISMTPAKIESGKNFGWLFLHAIEDAAMSMSSVKLRGTAELDGTNITREARPVSLTWNVADPANEPVMSRAISDYVVSMIEEPMPIRLSAAEEKTWEAVAGSKVKIPLKIERDGEFTATFKLKPVGVAGLDSAKEFDLDPKATNAVYEIDLAQQKLAPGTYSFTLQGLASASR
jgi:hypothetical protein